jgi:hypothetical protein
MKCSQEKEQSGGGRSLKLMNEEGIGKHRFEGIENDEGQSGTYVVLIVVRAVPTVVQA